MEPINLWGQDFKPDKIRTPSMILNEQASLVGKLTNYLLEGNVERSRQGDRLEFQLYIVARALENYAYYILDASYSIHSIYPVRVRDKQTYKLHECNDEQQFLEALGSILSSDQVKKVITTLLSQIKSEN